MGSSSGLTEKFDVGRYNAAGGAALTRVARRHATELRGEP
jgi:hypothetical protein